MTRDYTNSSTERKGDSRVPKEVRLPQVASMITYNLSRLGRLIAERDQLEAKELSQDELATRLTALQAALELTAWSPELQKLLTEMKRQTERRQEEMAVLVKPQPKSAGRIGGFEI